MDALHLYVLSAFAVSQPLLDRLARQIQFILQQQIDSRGLMLVLAAVMFAVPTAMLLIEWLTGLCCGSRVRRWLHRCFTFVLFLCLALQVQLTVMEVVIGWSWGVPGLLILGIAVAVAIWLTRLIERSVLLRKVIAYAAAGVIVFPAMFCLSSGIQDILFPRTVHRPTQIETPVPIVMVVFDGFNGMALLDEHHEIDSVRFPNFSRLARTSHWYRNATTVHPRTGNAVPALLTGRMPRDVVPTYREYPINLFQLLHDSGEYEMTIFEPSTHLAPRDLNRHRERHSAIQQAGIVLWHLGYIFLRVTIPKDLPPGIPDLPNSWFNLSEELHITVRTDTKGAFAYSWDIQRREQFEHFLDCIVQSEQPEFRFLHLVIPHNPWNYLPGGQCYAPQMTVGTFPLGAHGGIGEDWTDDALIVNHARQRYLLQLMFIDNMIGQLLDKLESTGLMDECLFVITADHGEAFVPGVSRREVVGDNISEVLPIPLFIKLPGQREGVISDRNVESIDVFPTIADVIGLELQSEVDGRAIFDPDQPPSLRKTFLSRWEPVAVSADFPERFRCVDRIIDLFGTGSTSDSLWDYSFMPELVGQPLANFLIEEDAGSDVQLFFGNGWYDSTRPDIVPCLFEGRVLSYREGDAPVTLVVALNGRIECVTRTILDERIPDWFSVLAPRAEFHAGDNDLQIFELLTTESGQKLRRCRLQQNQP